MTVYIGVDFHPYEQSVAYADDRDGEIMYKRFLHSDKKSIKAFYRKCGQDAVIGVEVPQGVCGGLRRCSRTAGRDWVSEIRGRSGELLYRGTRTIFAMRKRS